MKIGKNLKVVLKSTVKSVEAVVNTRTTKNNLILVSNVDGDVKIPKNELTGIITEEGILVKKENLLL